MDYQHILKKLIERKIELFCVCGQFSQQWEDAMDWLLTDDPKFKTSTTSHIDEPLEDVIDMANMWFTEHSNKDVEIINV